MLASVGREPDDVHPRVRRARTGVRRHGRRAGPCTRRTDRRRRPDQRRGDRKRSAALVHHTEAPFTSPRGGRLRRRRGRGGTARAGDRRRHAAARGGGAGRLPHGARGHRARRRRRVRHPLRREYGGGPSAATGSPGGRSGAADRTRAAGRVGSGSAEGGFLAQALAGGIQTRGPARLRRSGRRTATIRGGEGSGPEEGAVRAARPRRSTTPQARAGDGPGRPADRRKASPESPAGAGATHYGHRLPPGRGRWSHRPQRSSPGVRDQRRRERGAATPAQRGNPPPQQPKASGHALLRGRGQPRRTSAGRGRDRRAHRAAGARRVPARAVRLGADGDLFRSSVVPRRAPLHGRDGSPRLAGPGARGSRADGAAGGPAGRRGDGLLRAGSAILDRSKGILKLEGGVLGIQGRQVFLADAAVVDLNARTAELTKAVLFLKERTPNPDAPRSGANTMTLRGSRVRELSRGRYLAEKVTLTPCDCAGDPDYELIADTAELEGDRAHLRGVHLHLLGATLPLFPLSLPLTSRQSGLLAPQIGFGAPIGFTYAQPIFLTLGRSNDLTVTPGWYTGGHAHQQTPGLRSIRGPRLGLEWRYAPAEGTAGSVALDLYDDLDQKDSPARPGGYSSEKYGTEYGTSEGRGFGGVRGVARLAHRTDSAAGVFAMQGVVASDVMVVRDPQPQSIETSYDLFTTDLGFWRARGPLTLGADATLMQDMRVDPVTIDRRLFGVEKRATMQRLPAAFVQLAPVELGRATVSLEASAVQYVRFSAAGPQERATGFSPTDRGARSEEHTSEL